MAGDWIKMRTCLRTDPAVVRISSGLNLDRHSVVGRLHAIWSWADEHSIDGTNVPVGREFINELVECQGFAEQMIRVGWLKEEDGSLTFPNFSRHNGESAKARLTDAQRKRNERTDSGQVPDASRTKKRPEKRRGDSSSSSSSTRARGGKQSPEPEPEPAEDDPRWLTLRDAWNAGKGKRWAPLKPPRGLGERLAEPGWFEEILEAILRIPSMGYYRASPPTLLQAIAPDWAQRANGGGYDDLSPAKHRGGQDDRPPLKVDPDWQRKKREAEEREERKRLGVVAAVGDVLASKAKAISGV